MTKLSMTIKKTTRRSKKKLIAVFNDGRPSIKFGSKHSTTFAEGATEQQRLNYIARHQKREDWEKITPGSLSRFVLWERPSLREGIKAFQTRFLS